MQICTKLGVVLICHQHQNNNKIIKASKHDKIKQIKLSQQIEKRKKQKVEKTSSQKEVIKLWWSENLGPNQVIVNVKTNKKENYKSFKTKQKEQQMF